MNGKDLFWIGAFGAVAIFAAKGYNKLFGDNPMSQEEQKDFSEQSIIHNNIVIPKEDYPNSQWAEDFKYNEVEQSSLDETYTLIRATDKDGNLSTFRFNPDDFSSSQRWFFEKGFWDFENDTLQFGFEQGAERLLRGKLGETLEITQVQNPQQTKAEKVNEIKEQTKDNPNSYTSGPPGSGADVINSYKSNVLSPKAEATLRSNWSNAKTTEDKKSAIAEAWAAAGL